MMEMRETIDAARRAAGLTWTELADRVGGPRVHTTAALLGQHPLPAEQAERAAEALGLDAELAERLTEIPEQRSARGSKSRPTRRCTASTRRSACTGQRCGSCCTKSSATGS